MKPDDARARFARAHLGTPAELAVYLALDHRRPGFLSAAEIARVSGCRRDEVERVLESFAPAGIVQSVRAWGAPRYRRRAEIDYLPEGHFGRVGDVDPVCGMLSPSGTPYVERDARGTEIRFCSSRCRAAFIAFPGVFGRAPAGDRGPAR